MKIRYLLGIAAFAVMPASAATAQALVEAKEGSFESLLQEAQVALQAKDAERVIEALSKVLAISPQAENFHISGDALDGFEQPEVERQKWKWWSSAAAKGNAESIRHLASILKEYEADVSDEEYFIVTSGLRSADPFTRLAVDGVEEDLKQLAIRQEGAFQCAVRLAGRLGYIEMDEDLMAMASSVANEGKVRLHRVRRGYGVNRSGDTLTIEGAMGRSKSYDPYRRISATVSGFSRIAYERKDLAGGRYIEFNRPEGDFAPTTEGRSDAETTLKSCK